MGPLAGLLRRRGLGVTFGGGCYFLFGGGCVAPGVAVGMCQGQRGWLLLLVQFGGFRYDGRWFGGAGVHILEERSGRGRRSVQSLLLQLVVLRFGVASRAVGALHSTATPTSGARRRKKTINPQRRARSPTGSTRKTGSFLGLLPRPGDDCILCRPYMSLPSAGSHGALPARSLLGGNAAILKGNTGTDGMMDRLHLQRRRELERAESAHEPSSSSADPVSILPGCELVSGSSTLPSSRLNLT